MKKTKKTSLNLQKQKVFKERKIFGKIIEKWSEKNWVNYYKHTPKELLNPSKEILNIVSKEIEEILDKNTAKQSVLSLKEKKWTDSADHHGLLIHPYFYTGALARSHPKTISKSGVTVVLSFGNVSLSNDSFPRGLFFYDSNLNKQKIAFKSLKERSLPVSVLKSPKKEDFKSQINQINQFSLKKESKEKLKKFLNQILLDKRIWKLKDYSSWLTRANYILWHEIFGDERGELVYLDIDSISRNLLLQKHLTKKTSVWKLLFTEKWRDEYIKNIKKTNLDPFYTHFFWRIDHKNLKREDLYITKDTLQNKDGTYKVKLDPQTISKKIKSKELLPSSILTLIIIHAEESLACAGGFSQIEYLKDITILWKNILKASGINKKIPNPSIFSGEFVACAVEREKTKKIASFIDILLYTKSPNDQINTILEKTKIIDTIDAIIPNLYWLITKEKVEEEKIKITSIGHV